MAFTRRDAAEADLPALVAIYNAAIADRQSTCDLEPVSVDSRRAWFAQRSATRPIWVAHDERSGDEVLGYLAVSDFLNGRAGYAATADVAVYLHPEHRGQGLGDYLLGEAVRVAPSLGLHALAATIFASNTASLRLFTGQGFQRWGYLPGVARLGGGIVRDIVFMGRPVG